MASTEYIVHQSAQSTSMEATKISYEVVSKLLMGDLQPNEFVDGVSRKVLRVLVEELGIDLVADWATHNPNKGYFVRYLDDITPKLLA